MPDADYNLVSLLFEYIGLWLTLLGLLLGGPAVTYYFTKKYYQTSNNAGNQGRGPNQFGDGGADNSATNNNHFYAPIGMVDVGNPQNALNDPPVNQGVALPPRSAFLLPMLEELLTSVGNTDFEELNGFYIRAWRNINERNYEGAKDWYHVLLGRLEVSLQDVSGSEVNFESLVRKVDGDVPVDARCFEEIDNHLILIIKDIVINEAD